MSTQTKTHKLYIETVGCQMNMLDSEMVVASLRREGYELSDNVGDADTILFNTCLLYTSPSPRDRTRSRMPSSA